jgi:uncharacterized protein (TIGR03067 family)
MTRALALALAGGLLAPAGGDRPDVEKEKQKIQGAWEAVLLRQGSGDVPGDQLRQIRLEITGDERVITSGAARTRSRFTLDPSQDPRAIDVRPAEGDGKVRKGIYRIDGDLQVICLGAPGGERPKRFAADPGEGETLMVFRRPGSKQPPPEFKPAAEAKDPGLRKELLARMKADQDFRHEVEERFGSRHPIRTEEGKREFQALIEKGKAVDRDNTAWLKGVVDKHGWPGKSLVGSDGALAAFLLVQHADLDPAFQKKCLGLMAEAVKNKEASPANLAYLTDRVALKERGVQVYGTQLRVEEGGVRPAPIEDEANVDRRRQEVGLPPLAEYLKAVRDGAGPAAKDGGKEK